MEEHVRKFQSNVELMHQYQRSLWRVVEIWVTFFFFFSSCGVNLIYLRLSGYRTRKPCLWNHPGRQASDELCIHIFTPSDTARVK